MSVKINKWLVQNVKNYIPINSVSNLSVKVLLNLLFYWHVTIISKQFMAYV